jgi:acetyl esterase
MRLWLSLFLPPSACSLMPLDPLADKFLKQLAALNLPDVHQGTPQQARELMLTSIPGLGPPEAVTKVEDRRIAGPGGEVPLRLYWPAAGATLAGAVVFFHGGGWVVGDLATHDNLCRALCNAAGCLVVAVDYRLAPEHRFPAAPEDAFAATRWVQSSAGELGIGGDRQGAPRVAIAGDSAGGNLAAVVSLMCRDRGAPPPALQVLIYPATDYNLQTPSYRACAEGYMLTRDAMAWFWRQYLTCDEDGHRPYASPLRANDLAGLPRALVVTAQYDPLCDEGEAYAQKLTAAGVPTRLVRYDGMIHGFLRRLTTFPAAKAALGEIAREVRSAFEVTG